MIKKIANKLFVLFLVVNICTLNFSYADDDDFEYVWIDEAVEEIKTTERLEILSNSAIIYDRTSKITIWGKNEDLPVPMASTTKIMTALVMVEELGEKRLKEEIEVCQEAANTGGSSLGIKTGDRITFNDLLYGLMLPSGNDAAVQIAISISGSIEEFANLMNKKAKEIGLENTRFVTPHGLDREGHYTTAKELAIITDYAISNPIIAKVVSTKKYTVYINGYPKTLSNSNELLGYLNGVTGVKTGYTSGAGRCLVTSVERNGFNIIVVVLGADTKKIRTKDSIKLIEYTYKNYELRNLEEIIVDEYNNWRRINKDRIYVYKGIQTKVEVYLCEFKYRQIPVMKNKQIDINSEVKIYFEAPLYKDTYVGKIVAEVDGNVIEEVMIKSKETIRRKEVFDYFIEFTNIYKQVI